MFRLALPVVLTNLGLITMALVDLICVGRVSATALGAVGIGTAVFAWFMIFGLGLLTSLEFLISHAYGSGRHEDCRRAWSQGILLSFIVGVPLTLVLVGLSFSLGVLGVNPTVLPEAREYLLILSFSLIPVLVFGACRQYLQSTSRADPALHVLLAANVVNAIANFALVFGHWGFPSWGARGSATSTLIARIFMMVAILAYVGYWDRKNHRLIRWSAFRPDPEVLRQILRVGLPAALQMTFEVGVFALTTTLAARLDPHALAAHQVVLNIASITFMVPLGVSSATAVLVSREIGRGERGLASQMGWKGVSLGTGFMALSCILLLGFPDFLLTLYTKDAQVLATAHRIILVAALFQLSDGAQCVLTGALRGLAETKSPMFANLVGHWLIGLPIGIFLCFFHGFGLLGLWIGLSVGLTVVALALLLRWLQLNWPSVPYLNSRNI